jgi:Nuclease-related domain
VIHDVPADGFNLDHVVIAPQGVFVIETKTRTKPPRRDARVTFAAQSLRVAGYAPDRDPIGKVRASCRWLSELLSDSTGKAVPVRGVVVFAGWFIESMTRDWLNGGNPWVLEPKSLRDSSDARRPS